MRNNAILFLFALFAAFLSTTSHAQIYKCTVNGKMTFTDKPCAGGESVSLQTINSANKIDDINYPTTSTTANKVYKSSHWYEDATGYQQALRKAKKYQAPMIIYFRTDWCGFCTAVDKNLLQKPSAKKVMQGFVKVSINPDHGDAEKKIFKQTFNGTGYPTFLVKPYGKNAKRIDVTGNKPNSGNEKNISVDAFAEKIQKYIPKPLPPTPQNAQEFHASAQSLYEQKKYALALNDIKKAIQRSPKTIKHYQLLDTILLVDRDFEQIIEYWKKFIALVPNNATAYMERSGTYYHQGNLQAAINDAKKAADLGHNDAKSWHQKLLRLSTKQA